MTDELHMPATHSNREIHEYLEELKSDSNGSIVVTYPKVKWDDVIVKDEIKDFMTEKVTLRLKFPHLFRGARRPMFNVLLHGPRGVGKTAFIKAAVSRCEGIPFIHVFLPILTKHFSPDRSVIKKLFDVAFECPQCVIVFDDLDHLSATDESEGKMTDAGLVRKELLDNLIYIRMNSMQNDIILLAVTSKPWTLDASLRRCFTSRLYVPLPSTVERSAILQKNFQRKHHKLTEDNFILLGDKSIGCSGLDLVNISRAILAEPVRRVKQSTHFKQVPKTCEEHCAEIGWTPCAADDKDAVLKSWTCIESDDIVEPPITLDMAVDVLDSSKSSVSPEEIKMYEKFIDEYG